MGVPEDRSQFVCMVVVGADDCLELRAYPSFEGEVLDCLPSGTRLLESQRDFSGPHQTEDGVVWHLLRTAEGEWLGWAEAQFLKGTASFRNPSWKISLRRPSAVGVCVPGDPLAFDDPEPRFQYGIFSCLAVAGVDDCLEVREKPGLDARKLDCVPDGTRLLEVQSSPIAVEDTDGVAWRSVRWADGRWAGWVNSHHLDGPAPTTVVPAGQLLPTVEFPDDVALIASPFPRAGVPRGWGPTELVRIYQRLGQGLVIETLFHANNFYWTADGTVLGGYVCLGNHDPMSRACTGEETAHYESRDGGVTLERFVLSSQASLDYLGDYIGDARFRADDIDLRISDQLHFLPSFLSPSTSYKVGDLLGGAAESVSGVFSADHEMHWALHWPTIRNVETGEEWPIAFPAELLMLGDSFIPRLVLHGPFLRVVGVEEDCLPVRRQPSHHADELDCVAGRVLLQDQGDTATDDAITWRRVKTPAGIAGWADAKYLGQ
ncbi:MAG: SH3 domain-containing protein [Dehalococcoidia bacterium]|nr:SH3 domain-containing protein [Dehalococcoidia bacterium]